MATGLDPRSHIAASPLLGRLPSAAIDQLADRLDRQTKKHKEQIRNHHAREAQKADLAAALDK